MKDATLRLEDFSDQYPDEARWIEENHASFGFAKAMRERIVSHACLTPNMLAAVRRCMTRPKLDPEAAPEADASKLEAVFARVNKNLRTPALTIGSYRFSPAPDTGRNPGAIYVKEDGQYLGKLMNGRFLSRATQEAVNAVLGIAADPLGKAIEHGKLTGRCAVCSRKLTRDESVGRAMGPICYSKFFGGFYGE